MAPKEVVESFIKPSGVLNETEGEIDGSLAKPADQEAEDRKFLIVWNNVIIMTILHVFFFGGLWMLLTGRTKWQTNAFALALYFISGFGITAGAHRLWCHRCYKAKVPLRVILMIFNTIAFQDCVIKWARDHRVHHKFSDTDADPHNSTRGFFFSHIGWLLVKKHPNVREAGQKIDISDLKEDPVLQFQKKYYGILMPTLCFLLPTFIPALFWNESWLNSWLVPACFRYVLTLHITWSLNSFAHMFGHKSYDKRITPTQNVFVAGLALGEGWHNFHHSFPWDYKTSELGAYRHNLSTGFIDLFAKIGWAYDLKTVNQDIINIRMARTGDGTKTNIWGYCEKSGLSEVKKSF